jgi:hypothetical protein
MKNKECKLISSYLIVCKQNNLVQVTYFRECEVEMLQSGQYCPAVSKELQKSVKPYGFRG